MHNEKPKVKWMSHKRNTKKSNLGSLKDLGALLAKNREIVKVSLWILLGVLAAHWSAACFEEAFVTTVRLVAHSPEAEPHLTEITNQATKGASHLIATNTPERSRQKDELFWLLVIGVVCTVLALVTGWIAWYHRHAFRELHCPEPLLSDSAKKECLIFFISDQKILPGPHHKEVPASGPLTLVKTGPPGSIPIEKELPRKALTDAEINLLDPLNWNWQQILRGLKPHLGGRRDNENVLRMIYLIGSAADQVGTGTFHHRHHCENFIKPYVGEAKITRWPVAIDFEDVVELEKNLREIIEEAVSQGCPKDRICIDVTGGQKPASIAGAIATLNSPVTIQYVQTFSKDPKRALQFDLRFLSPVESSE